MTWVRLGREMDKASKEKGKEKKKVPWTLAPYLTGTSTGTGLAAKKETPRPQREGKKKITRHGRPCLFGGG